MKRKRQMDSNTGARLRERSRRDSRTITRTQLIVACAALMTVMAGCGDGARPSGADSAATATETVAVSLDEWGIGVPTTLEAGSVTFDVVNDGTMNHQLTIVAAESYEALPLRENGSVRIEALDPSALAVNTEPLFAGFPAESVTVDLAPGTYVFFCNLQSFSGNESHVGLGQRLVVAVR